MAENNVLKYHVDIVFCIDATGSMEGILDKVKKRVLHFHDDLVKTMEGKSKHVDGLRVRIVAFRDFIADEDDAMFVTDFFNLPEQSEIFADCIKSIHPDGGGDVPEDSLEALAYAIRSDWLQTKAMRTRHIIVMWTDAAPHPLGYGKKSKFYPSGMPRDLTELSAWWGAPQEGGYMDNRSKRLLLYAPEEPTWRTICDSWNNTILYPSKAGNGLGEIEYQQILDLISNTI